MLEINTKDMQSNVKYYSLKEQKNNVKFEKPLNDCLTFVITPQTSSATSGVKSLIGAKASKGNTFYGFIDIKSEENPLEFIKSFESKTPKEIKDIEKKLVGIKLLTKKSKNLLTDKHLQYNDDLEQPLEIDEIAPKSWTMPKNKGFSRCIIAEIGETIALPKAKDGKVKVIY